MYEENKLVKMNYEELGDVIENFISEGEFRVCSECGKIMNHGYCIENGMDYYCDDDCLYKNIDEDAYSDLYDNGDGNTYWTEWESNPCFYELIKYILNIRKDLNYKLQEM